jgi:hypothetical protein
MLTPPGFMRNFGTDAAAQQKCCDACANNADCGVAVLATDQVPFVRIACTHAHAHTHTRTLPTLSELSAMAVATHHTATLHATEQLHGPSRHSPRLQAITVIRINKGTLTSTASRPPTRNQGGVCMLKPKNTTCDQHPSNRLGCLPAGHHLPSPPPTAPTSPPAPPPPPLPAVPKWTPTYNMSESTVMMPCNYSGNYDYEAYPSLAKFGLVDYDW